MIIFTHSASHPTIENHIPSYHVIFVFFYWLIESHHTHLPSTIYNWHTYISFHKIRSEWPFELNIHGWLFVMRTRWHTKNIRHRIFFYQYTHILYTKTHAYFSLYICGVLFVYWFTFWFSGVIWTGTYSAHSSGFSVLSIMSGPLTHARLFSRFFLYSPSNGVWYSVDTPTT